MKLGCLEILREEHAQLQIRLAELQKQHDILLTSFTEDAARASKHSFIQRIVSLIGDMYRNNLYSDIAIHCDGHQMLSHRFIISARTNYWTDLPTLDRIEFLDMTYSEGSALLKWMYTDELDMNLRDSCMMNLLSAAVIYRFDDLRDRCELLLCGRVDIDNCVTFYEFSEKKNLSRLSHRCSEFISAQWDNLHSVNFDQLSGPSLYRIMKSHYHHHLLHSIIRMNRQDVLFFYFIENDSQLPSLINDYDDMDNLPLQLAIDSKYFNIADELVEHKSDVNFLHKSGKPLLLIALERGQIEACDFLVEHGANMNFADQESGEGLLHKLARNCSGEMLQWISYKLDRLNMNEKNRNMATPLIISIESNNSSFTELLLGYNGIDVNSSDLTGRSPLFISLFEANDVKLADKLLKAGANITNSLVYGWFRISQQKACCNCLLHGGTWLHHAVKRRNLMALNFLCEHRADHDVKDCDDLTPLQTAINLNPFVDVILKILIKAGSDISVITWPDHDTILHMAVRSNFGVKILEIFISESDISSLLSKRNVCGNTVLSEALCSNRLAFAELLIKAGGNVNEKNHNGDSLLVQAMETKNDDAALFLINNGASISDNYGKSLLHIAVSSSLHATTRALCNHGVDMNELDPATGFPPLWTALEDGDFDIAYKLVAHGCDINMIANDSVNNVPKTLLDLVIDRRLTRAAIFLIESGCSLNSVNNGVTAGSEFLSLHRCINSKLEDVALSLIKNGVILNNQDTNGRTAVHLAVLNGSKLILDALLAVCDPSTLLICDCDGRNPLALAVSKNDLVSARSIVEKSPESLNQYMSNGKNLLHQSVENANYESVLLLLSLGVVVNDQTSDNQCLTALHINSQVGGEMIMRNLILAGACVNARTSEGSTALHLTAFCGNEELCLILLENGIDCNSVDRNGNTALHLAVSQGCVSTVKLLLSVSRVNVRALNDRHQNPLIMLARCKSVSNSLDILHTFMRNYPDYSIDLPDQDGNTHNLDQEPKWAEGDFCSQCSARFSLTTRRHHCRHCGRLICSHCSECSMPIIKYNLQKPVRVCQICSDVLTMGFVESP